MYIQKKPDGIQKNFTVGEFLRTQKLGKHPLSTEMRPDLFNYNDFYKAHYIESFYTKYPE